MQEFSSSSPSYRKRVLKGDCNFVCGLDVEVVEADTSLRPLNVILAYGSSVVISSREERALVVVEEASLEKRDNTMGWLECGAESTEWKSSCLA